MVHIDPEGVEVETEHSKAGGKKEIVPGWMFNVAWDELTKTGKVRRLDLVKKNVRRASAVMALLACLPGVELTSTSPMVLSYQSDA